MFRTTAEAKGEGLDPVRLPHYPIPISVLLEQSVLGLSAVEMTDRAGRDFESRTVPKYFSAFTDIID